MPSGALGVDRDAVGRDDYGLVAVVGRRGGADDDHLVHHGVGVDIDNDDDKRDSIRDMDNDSESDQDQDQDQELEQEEVREPDPADQDEDTLFPHSVGCIGDKPLSVLGPMRLDGREAWLPLVSDDPALLSELQRGLAVLSQVYNHPTHPLISLSFPRITSNPHTHTSNA